MRVYLLAASIIIFLQACSSKANETRQIENKEMIPVKLVRIDGDTSLKTITASGLLSTEDETKLSFKIGGIVENILVKEGDHVRKGQLLATLKSTEIAAQVQQVQFAVEKAQRDYQRANNLYRDSVATLEQLQNAKTGLDIAKQSLQQVIFNQQYSKIYAPADGFVVKKISSAGELVSVGSVVLVMNNFSSSSRWILKPGLSDQDWSVIENGNKADVSMDAFPGKIFSGVVSKKSLAADQASGSFNIEVEINFGKEQPAVGMFGKASIHVNHSSVGYSIPYEALLEADGKKGFVFVSDDGRSVKKAEVTIASIGNNVAYISDGLQGHSFVVTSGSPYLTDNSLIKQ